MIGFRIRAQSGCPVCSGHRVLIGFNDLATTRPDLAHEWHPSKNGRLTPECVTAGTGKDVWRLGACGHEWRATANNRTNRGSGCPQCLHSKIEAALLARARETFPDAYHGTVDVRWGKSMRRAECDLVVPSVGVILEYDGVYWHIGKEAGDAVKTEALLGAGYHVIRVRDSSKSLTLPLLPITHPRLTQIQRECPTSERARSRLATEMVALIESLARAPGGRTDA